MAGRARNQARSGASFAARPPASSDKQFSARERREKLGRGGGKPNSKPPGMNDPYGIDIAPLNIFKNQIVPAVVHKLSKSFRPNKAYSCVIKIIQTKFEDFKRRLQNKMYFSEITPDSFCLKNRHFKN